MSNQFSDAGEMPGTGSSSQQTPQDLALLKDYFYRNLSAYTAAWSQAPVFADTAREECARLINEMKSTVGLDASLNEESGLCALNITIMRRQYEASLMLLDAGARPDVPSVSGTPLQRMIDDLGAKISEPECGDRTSGIALLKRLTEARPPEESRFEAGSPLQRVVSQLNPWLTAWLLKAGHDPRGVDANGNGIFVHCLSGYIDEIQWGNLSLGKAQGIMLSLFEHGADPRVLNKQGLSAIEAARIELGKKNTSIDDASPNGAGALNMMYETIFKDMAAFYAALCARLDLQDLAEKHARPQP